MKYNTRNPNINKELFLSLFTPSWLSFIIAVVSGLTLTLSVIASVTYQSSPLRLEVIAYKSTHGTTYHVTQTGILANPFIANLPLIAFWAIVGIAVYFFTINTFRAISSTAALKEELDYVNVNRHDLVLSAVEQLAVHIVVLVLWVAYLVFFLHVIIPYCINVAIVAAGDIGALQALGYALFATIVMMVAMHIHAVFLRLLVLRPRVFSSSSYSD
jgi:hypothetical protein